jgi:hypothetical protein
MISTAILMEMGADQASVRPTSSDRGAIGGLSFAESFDERVGEAAEILGKGPAGQVGTESQSLKDEPPVKIPNEAFAMLPELKEKTVVAGEASEYLGARGPVSAKIVPLQKVALQGSQAKTMVGDSEMKDVQSPADVECATDGNSAIPQDANGSNSKKDVFLSQVNAEDRPFVPSSEEIVVQKRTTRTGTTLEAVPAEKNTKSQSGKAAPTVLQKVATVPHPVAIAAGPVSATMTQGTDPKMGHTIEPVRTPDRVTSVAPKAELNNTSESGFGGGVSATGTVVTKDSLVRKDIAGGEPAGVDAETAPPVVGDQEGSTNPGVRAQKLLSTATPTSGDGDVRAETTSGLATTVAHVIASSAVGTSDMAHVNSPNDTSVMKLAPGETGGRATGLPVGGREQDISGVVGGSIDRPQMLTATPTALEVGVQNGTHGWLKVRAEMTETGVVNASVSASSTTGQEMLRRELPALATYLQSEKVAVNAVTVHATTAEPRGASAGMDGGSAGQTLQGGNEGGGRRQAAPETVLNGADDAVGYESLNAVDDNEALPLATYVGGGSWLSIRA